MQQLALFSISIFLLLTSCTPSPKNNKNKNIVFEEYFPLKNGVGQIYYVTHLKDADSLLDKNHTNVCLYISINNKQVFYFTDEPKDTNSIIGSQSFCNGAFYFDNGAFFVSPIFWRKDLQSANLDYFEPLFPKEISLDSVYKYRDGEEKRKYIFNKIEDVSIKEKKIPGCLKLTIIQDWPTSHYADSVWFQQGIGVVKWYRSTGRLEEIKL